jgi:hypothetical protein
MSIEMNGSLELQVEIGIGPQLVIMGTIIGSLFVGALANSITEKISWDEISYVTSSVQEIENTSHDQISKQDQEIALANPQNEAVESAPNLNEQTQCQVSDTYPSSIMQWCSEISTYALAYDLSPDLIAAVILQESGGNPDAYSHSGAVGLMQVMPRDGIATSFMCINGPCFSSRPTITELQDPTFNIEYGTRMLANLQAKYGNIRDALKYYGPMDVGYTYADKVLAIFDNNQ